MHLCAAFQHATNHDCIVCKQHMHFDSNGRTTQTYAFKAECILPLWMLFEHRRFYWFSVLPLRLFCRLFFHTNDLIHKETHTFYRPPFLYIEIDFFFSVDLGLIIESMPKLLCLSSSTKHFFFGLIERTEILELELIWPRCESDTRHDNIDNIRKMNNEWKKYWWSKHAATRSLLNIPKRAILRNFLAAVATLRQTQMNSQIPRKKNLRPINRQTIQNGYERGSMNIAWLIAIQFTF